VIFPTRGPFSTLIRCLRFILIWRPYQPLRFFLKADPMLGLSPSISYLCPRFFLGAHTKTFSMLIPIFEVLSQHLIPWPGFFLGALPDVRGSFSSSHTCPRFPFCLSYLCLRFFLVISFQSRSHQPTTMTLYKASIQSSQ